MIYIDVFVAGTGKSYEFRCNEKKTVGEVAAVIYKSVLKKENIEDEFINEQSKSQKGSQTTAFWMCSTEQERILEDSMTMEECGIENGHRLILI